MQQQSEPNDQNLQWYWSSNQVTRRSKYFLIPSFLIVIWTELMEDMTLDIIIELGTDKKSRNREFVGRRLRVHTRIIISLLDYQYRVLVHIFIYSYHYGVQKKLRYFYVSFLFDYHYDFPCRWQIIFYHYHYYYYYLSIFFIKFQ